MNNTHRLDQSAAILVITAACVFACPHSAFAEWTKTIECPADRTYRDVRRDAGREEFCELHLPGSLAVNDGPYRSWFSEGHPGQEGTYQNGRQIGKWRECNRFDRCEDRTYEVPSSQELAQAIQPTIPVTYDDGKYVFDFRSCWSTWITKLDGDEPELELNIGHGIMRCEITHIPSASERPPYSTTGQYLCTVPFAVGVRRFDSLDLREEFAKAGLPQFCRHDSPSPEQRRQFYEDPDFAIRIWVNAAFIDARNQPNRGWTIGANTPDVECASIQKSNSGPDTLTIRLNRYAEDLLVERQGKDDMRADACTRPFALGPMQVVRDDAGRTLFRFALSEKAATARRQTSCIAAQIKLQTSCSTK